MRLVRRKLNLPEVIAQSVAEHQNRQSNPLAFIYPEISDHLLERLLAERQEDLKAAKVLEAHTLRLNLAAAEIEGGGSLKKNTALAIYQKLFKGIMEPSFRNNRKAKFYMRMLPAEIQRIRQMADYELVEVKSEVVKDAMLVYQAKLKRLLGTQYGPFIKALNKSVKLAAQKINNKT